MRTNTNILDIVNDVLAWDLSDECISDAVSVHADHMAGWDAEGIGGNYCNCVVH